MNKEATYCVYAHRNKKNGKIYVGCTKQRLNERFDNGNGYKSCTRFWNDIVKYGFDNFDHIVIKDGMNREEAMKLEEVLVDTFMTMNPDRGYNMRSGGEHNVPCAEVGRAISQAKMGHPVSEETRKKLSMYNWRPVVQLSLDGDFIRVFQSMKAAADEFGINKTNIYAVCTGKRPTARGYRWSYLDE